MLRNPRHCTVCPPPAQPCVTVGPFWLCASQPGGYPPLSLSLSLSPVRLGRSSRPQAPRRGFTRRLLCIHPQCSNSINRRLDTRATRCYTQAMPVQRRGGLPSNAATRCELASDRKSTRLNSSHVEISYAV